MRLGVSIPIRFSFGGRRDREMVRSGRKLHKEIVSEQRRLKQLGDVNFERNGVRNVLHPYESPIDYEAYPKNEF